MNCTISYSKKIAVIFFLFTLICGCATVDQQETTKGLQKEGYTVEQRIKILIEALYLAKGPNYYATCRELANYKEEALPLLAKGTENRLRKIRLGCIFTIGQIYLETASPQALELREKISERLRDPIKGVRLEAARVLAEMKDYRGIPVLIKALTDRNPYVRMNAAKVLENTFHITFRYHHNAPPEMREQGAQKWESWWVKNRDRYIPEKLSS